MSNAGLFAPKPYSVDRPKLLAMDISRTRNWWGHFLHFFNCKADVPNIRYYECGTPLDFDFSGRTIMHICMVGYGGWDTGFSLQLKERYPAAFADFVQKSEWNHTGPIISVDRDNHVQIISLICPMKLDPLESNKLLIDDDDCGDRIAYNALLNQLKELKGDYLHRQLGILQSEWGFHLFDDERSSESVFMVTMTLPEQDFPITDKGFYHLLTEIGGMHFNIMLQPEDFPIRILDNFSEQSRRFLSESYADIALQRSLAESVKLRETDPVTYYNDENKIRREVTSAWGMRGF